MNSVQAVSRLRSFLLRRGKKKMKIILTCQIFSHSVVCGLRLHLVKKHLPPDVLQTVHFVETANRMWDFVDLYSLSVPPRNKRSFLKL